MFRDPYPTIFKLCYLGYCNKLKASSTGIFLVQKKKQLILPMLKRKLKNHFENVLRLSFSQKLRVLVHNINNIGNKTDGIFFSYIFYNCRLKLF